MLPVTVGVVHPAGCFAQFTDSDRRFFDPRVFERNDMTDTTTTDPSEESR